MPAARRPDQTREEFRVEKIGALEAHREARAAATREEAEQARDTRGGPPQADTPPEDGYKPNYANEGERQAALERGAQRREQFEQRRQQQQEANRREVAEFRGEPVEPSAEQPTEAPATGSPSEAPKQSSVPATRLQAEASTVREAQDAARGPGDPQRSSTAEEYNQRMATSRAEGRKAEQVQARAVQAQNAERIAGTREKAANARAAESFEGNAQQRSQTETYKTQQSVRAAQGAEKEEVAGAATQRAQVQFRESQESARAEGLARERAQAASVREANQEVMTNMPGMAPTYMEASAPSPQSAGSAPAEPAADQSSAAGIPTTPARSPSTSTAVEAGTQGADRVKLDSSTVQQLTQGQQSAAKDSAARNALEGRQLDVTPSPPGTDRKLSGTLNLTINGLPVGEVDLDLRST